MARIYRLVNLALPAGEQDLPIQQLQELIPEGQQGDPGPPGPPGQDAVTDTAVPADYIDDLFV